MGTDGLDPQVPGELAGITPRLLLVSLKGYGDWKKANVTRVFKNEDLGSYGPHLGPWGAGGANPPGNHFHTKEGEEYDQE